MPKTYSQSDLLKVLNERIAGSSQKTVAEALGVTPQLVNDLVHGKRDISERIAKALGYTREIVFRKAA